MAQKSFLSVLALAVLAFLLPVGMSFLPASLVLPGGSLPPNPCPNASAGVSCPPVSPTPLPSPNPPPVVPTSGAAATNGVLVQDLSGLLFALAAAIAFFRLPLELPLRAGIAGVLALLTLLSFAGVLF